MFSDVRMVLHFFFPLLDAIGGACIKVNKYYQSMMILL